ncbi:hypothetical protein KSC_005920 [Ktedonobacter sp. SOSP1-52]|uniref:hypothetical protein n=1 Tax=Ktedonobacter sp. SOSP1-52 TaxID=2778366 RepID=UPI001915C4B3|nr:hypothetical protein [Ktedonobacter sp. SOSP1-52]GHO61700.1 hypothetical protein KSC_005920 [Ktedonobacter sp. SOSP1-52]
MKSDEQKRRMELFRQYRALFGDLVSDGTYMVGDTITLVNGIQGKVIWTYRSHGKDVMYVLEDGNDVLIGITADGIAGGV